MHLKLVRHLWGVDSPFEEIFPKMREEGFEGIEWVVPPSVEAFGRLLKAHQLDYIALILTAGDTPEAHIESLKGAIEQVRPLEPVQVTCHGGRDSWSEIQREQFFTEALELEQKTGIPIAYETHRGRILFNPWTTFDLLNRFPGLKLCCDFSHWVCVCERLIDTEIEIVQRCAERCIHLHARIGHPEGPQVADPRAPESQIYLEAHERWWDIIWDAQAEKGMEISTLTPEYGPPPYLQTLPYTGAPVSNLWEICRWQAQREADRFAQRQNRG